MKYANHTANYQLSSDIDFASDSDDYERPRRNDYSRGESYKTLRRRARRKSNQHHAGPGISGRRNRYYSV